MKRFITLFILISLISCGSYKNEVWFNADGSGKTKLHLDLGEMMKQMKDAFKSMGSSDSTMADNTQWNFESDSTTYKENENMIPTDIPDDYNTYTDSTYQDLNYYDSTYTYDENDNSRELYEFDSFDSVEYKPDPAKEKMDNFFAGLLAGRTKIDTTISFYDMSVMMGTDTSANINLLKNCLFVIHGDSIKEEMWFDFIFNYKSEAEAKSIFKEFAAVSEKSGQGTTKSQYSDFNFTHDTKNKVIKSLPYNMYANGSLKEEDKSMFADMGGEEINQFLEMMGLGETVTTVHLPGKLIEVIGASFTKLDDKTIVIKQKTVDYIKSGDVPGYEIRYK